MPLKFTISRKVELVEIKDGAGNSTFLPHCGSFSFTETQATTKLVDKGITEKYKADFVAAVLKERLKKEDETIIDKTTEQILSDENGESIPDSLLNAMYNFLNSESRRWLPETERLYVRGENAVEIAIKYAEEHSLAAVQRSDMEVTNTVFVVDDISTLEKQSEINESLKQFSFNAIVESGEYDMKKIREINQEYYTWNILANHIPDKKKSKVKALTGTETTGS